MVMRPIRNSNNPAVINDAATSATCEQYSLDDEFKERDYSRLRQFSRRFFGKSIVHVQKPSM